MPHYIKCSSCNGHGYLSCDDCLCQTCNGKGKVNCSNCIDGYKPCELCNSTGQILQKRLFFSYSKPCPVCEGAKKISCYFCKGSGFVTCSNCKGTGRMLSCSTCNSTQKIQCEDCAGTGKIESKWFKSLTSLPIDRLDFEYKKRQQEVQTLKIDISRWSRELADLHQWHDRERQANPYMANHRGAYPSGIDSIPRKISGIEDRINELKDEMEAIDQVKSAKWK